VAETGKEISEDAAFKTKEKLQKSVDDANKGIEAALSAKIAELQE
jgi:ribosome recycling factor